METIILTVDGNIVDIGTCMCHAQEAAWPGGYCYEMRIKDDDIIQFIKDRYPQGEITDIDCQETNALLGYISVTVSMKWKKGPFRYCLNTITYLGVSQDKVVLKGDCSAYQRT